MFLSYLTVTIRGFLSRRAYSLVNVASLSIGIAFCILIFLFVHDEWTYDAFHKNGDRIFRLTKAGVLPNGQTFPSSGHRAGLGPRLKETFSEIELISRISGASTSRVTVGTKVFLEEVTFVDPSLMQMFTFPLNHGDAKTALSQEHSVVLSQELAQKYFGDENPIGNVLQIDNFNIKGESLIVTGVADKIPRNSSITFDILVPIDWIDKGKYAKLTDVGATYVLLAPGSSSTQLEEKITSWVKNLSDESAEGVAETRSAYQMESLIDIHFSSANPFSGPVNNPLYSYVLSTIAILVLVIACINYTTLSLGLTVR